jgi:hypothetical protein
LPPEEYEQAGREHPDVYQRLHAIAEQTADIRYWAKIARTERRCKDRSDKVPSIDFSPADDSAVGAQGDEADAELDDDDVVAVEFAGDIEGSASVYSAGGGPQGQIEPAKRPHREASIISASKRAKTGTSVGQQQYRRPQQQQAPEPDGEEIVDIYIGNGKDQKVFHLSRNNINKSSFLKGLIQGKFPYIMHPYLHQMGPAEFEPVCAFLSRDDGLESDLVSVYGGGAGDNDDDEEDLLGDVDKMGKFWKIKEVHNIEELKAYILQLGPTYVQACLLGLSAMAETVISKVQVAWNVYGRVDQLPVYLDFIESVIPNLAQDSARGSTPGAFYGLQSSYGFGQAQQSWIVRFLAETMILYATEAPQRFWSFMNKYPSLRASVFKHRGALDDAKQLDLEKKFLHREPLAEASFAIPVKMEENVEQEAAAKEKEGMEAMEQVVEVNE